MNHSAFSDVTKSSVLIGSCIFRNDDSAKSQVFFCRPSFMHLHMSWWVTCTKEGLVTRLVGFASGVIPNCIVWLAV